MSLFLSILLALASGIVSSSLASFIFIKYLSNLVPKIEISEYISKQEESGKIVYRVKVINKTRRPIINVKLNMHLVFVRVGGGGIRNGGGVIKRLVPVALATESVPEIAAFNPKDNEADYACRFRTYKDIETNLNDENENCYVRLTFSAVDSFSNFGKVYVQRYYRGSVREGSFGHGESLSVESRRY